MLCLLKSTNLRDRNSFFVDPSLPSTLLPPQSKLTSLSVSQTLPISISLTLDQTLSNSAEVEVRSQYMSQMHFIPSKLTGRIPPDLLPQLRNGNRHSSLQTSLLAM